MKIVKNNFWNANIKGSWIIIDENGLIIKDGFNSSEEAVNAIKELFKTI